jgi:CBS domain-containing protein
MTVGEFCNRQVVFARKEENIAEAARRMRDLHVGTLVIVDEQDGRRLPIGVLTDRDLVVRLLAQDGPIASATVVGDVMTSKLVTAQEDDDLVSALKKMRSFGVRRLPVVNERGALEGILAFDDFVEFVAEELSDLSSLLAREQKHEREAKSS